MFFALDAAVRNAMLAVALAKQGHRGGESQRHSRNRTII